MEAAAGKKPFVFDKGYLKRTILIGLAFFGILLVWQLYNSYCSPMLSLLFIKHDFPGAIDLAKTNMAIAVANGTLDAKDAVVNMKNILVYGGLTQKDYLSVQWKVGFIMALDNIAALFIMPLFGRWSDKTKSKLGKRMPYIIIGSVVTAIALPYIPLFFSFGMAAADAKIIGMIVGLICTMVVVIVFMMSYRSPAVSLMPDLTPKPLRSRANGIINVVGYVGGAFGAIFAIVIPVTSYIDGSNRSLWMLEIPFIVCSIILLASIVVLLRRVKENELHKQLDAEIRRGDALGESAEKVTKSGKLSRRNRINLALILIAEVFWFMSLNAVETFQTNYCMFWLNTSSAGGAIMTIVSGVASVIGFLSAGFIADKIGRKWTIFMGIGTVMLCYVIYAFIPQAAAPKTSAEMFSASLPWMFFILLPTIGFGTSLIHICSFPLVTDYCTSDKLGRFTALYYTASMLAQSVTPIVIGLIFQATTWRAMPIYSACLMFVAGAIFIFVKAPHRMDKAKNVKGLDALGADD
ncbi:MAG: MFS transporter [Bacilli bacterium]|nr:MFS transporter [Bacilli bacterium]